MIEAAPNAVRRFSIHEAKTRSGCCELCGPIQSYKVRSRGRLLHHSPAKALCGGSGAGRRPSSRALRQNGLGPTNGLGLTDRIEKRPWRSRRSRKPQMLNVMTRLCGERGGGRGDLSSCLIVICQNRKGSLCATCVPGRIED